MQEKYQWSNETTSIIAWKSLALAIQRIDRPVLTTKICNDLLPTMHHLHRRNWSTSNKCHLCGEIETREHLLRCTDPTRTTWKIAFINDLRKMLKNKLTSEGLSDTLARTITSWLDTGTVNASKYDRRYHDAINSQNSIGWMNLFSGRISQKWLELYEETMIERRTEEEQKHFKHYNGYIWGTALVEKILRKHIEL